MNSRDFCNNVVTIPQYSSTCWFNVILMSLLYSQNSRKLLMNNGVFKKRKDQLSIVLKKILYHHYIKHDDVGNYFNVLRPESILALCNIEPNVYKFMVENGWMPYIFLSRFIDFIGMNCLTIDYIDNILFTGLHEHIEYYVTYYNQINVYANLNNPTDIFFQLLAEKMRQKTNPDYICINLWNNNEQYNNPYLQIFNSFLYNPIFFERLQLNYYRPSYANLQELRDEIIYNGFVYKLDSCILGNYDISDTNHAICGIKCKNRKYVYNGWIRVTNDKAMANGNYGKDDLLPCELFPFDWNIHDVHNKFCLKPDKCKLSLIGNSINRKLCFSFGRGTRTLIYVKQTSKPSIDMNIKTTSDNPIFYTSPAAKKEGPPAKPIFYISPVANKKEKETPPVPKKDEKVLLTLDLNEYKNVINTYNTKILKIIETIKETRNKIKKIKNILK